MTTSVNSVINFLLSRAADAPLDPAELQDFAGELRAIINQLSVAVPDAVPDAVTVLYSGLLPDGQQSGVVADGLVAGSQPGRVRTISQTEIGTLLDYENTDFHDALLAALGNDDEDYRKLVDGKDLSGNRITSDSLWDDASRRFVANTTGTVRIISTDGSSSSVFARSELPELFNNANITEIDGIPSNQYRDLLDAKGMDAVRDVIYTNAGVQIELTDLANGNLQKYIDLDPGDNFNNYFELYKDEATRARLLSYFDGLDPERLTNLKAVTASAFEVGEELVTTGLAKGANKLGMLGTLAGFMLASYSSSVAAESGDQQRAKSIMTEWAADAAGSAAGEAVGVAIGGAAVAIIAAAGTTLSAPLTGAIVLGAALIGGIFGAEGAVSIYELTKDKDNDGKIDLFNAMADLLYGDDYTISDAPLPAFEGNRITLDTSFSRGEIVENAKASIAWRYALKHLNPFVIEGDETLYARHNRNNELDLENLSEQYLTDRAEMLLWRLRYDKAGVSYTEEWNTWELSGDWDFIDHAILINGEQSLKLSIDGWNGFPPVATSNHQVVFGSSGSETLSGGETSDSLYGREGDDRLQGNLGDDYLEGGKGLDSYRYNSGDGFDIIYDIDGSGRIILDDVDLSGEKKRIGESLYTDADATTYRFNDSGNGIGTLLINNNILIENFDGNAQAFLGITLGRDRIDDSVTVETTIIGTEEEDIDGVLDGTSGPDHIQGFAGNDWARGFIGADLIEGGLGNDILEGGQGDDVMHGDSAENVDQVVDSGGQNAGSSHDWLGGNAGDDQLYGSSGADVLAGGSGGDLIWGGAGEDIIQGDSERAPADHAWVDAWIADNDLRSSGELNPMDSGNDILLGGAGADRIWGQAGDDLINGGIGNDLISGDMVGLSGQGDRLLPGERHGADVIYGDQGEDILEGGGGDDMLFGGDDNDRLYGDAESLLMPDGNSLLLREVHHGQDSLFGNAGDDLLVGGAGSDHLEGGGGADSLYGDDETQGLDRESHGKDWLSGGAGNDLLLGNGGNDQLYGDGGADSVWGGAGDDYISGGAGSDYLVGDDGPENTELDGRDTLLGGTDDDRLFGLGGADRLDGGAGDDQLHGGAGSDSLAGGSGNDYLNGGAGADSYLFHTGDGIDLIAGDAEDQVSLPDSSEIAASLATGADGAAYLAIQYGRNDWVFIEGGLETAVDRYAPGNGRIYSKGELLNETLSAAVEYRMQAGGDISSGKFNDTLVGSPENDRIHGRDGDDILAGGGGDDHLLGGAGVDRYRVGWGTGRDLISEQANAVSHLELLPGATIDDLSYEREGDDLFIRIKDGRDGVLLDGYYNLNQSWQIIDQGGEILLNRDRDPQTTHALIADSAAAAWQAFNRGVATAYGGLLRLYGFDGQADGGFERTYTGGDVNNRWRNSYSVTLSTQPLDAASGSYQRLLPDMETTLTDIRQEVWVEEQIHLSGSGAAYVSAGRSGTSYIPTEGIFNGISVHADDLLVADYGPNKWRNPLTGELESEIKGYYVYPSGTAHPGTASVSRIYRETDYRLRVNIARITAGNGDDEISTGGTRFNLVDGGGGNDLLDASKVGESIPVPGRSSVTGVRMPGALLFGNSGDDALYGGALDDVLIGGQGRDFLSGDRGNDTYYLFDRNAGDRIMEWGKERVDGLGDDSLVLPDGVAFNDLSYEWGMSVETEDFVEPDRHARRVEVPMESMHTTLKLSWAGSDGVTLVLPHSDKSAGFGIDRLVTANGESRSIPDILPQAGPGPGQDPHYLDNTFAGMGILSGAAGNDWLTADPNEYSPLQTSATSVLIGGAGADRLTGQEGRNILIGGRPVAEGADGLPYNLRFSGTFWGDPGNTFSGGKGSDEIWTTAGSDTILFGLGDGTDTIESRVFVTEADHMTQLLNGHDTLRFGLGIAPSDISVFADDDNLIFSHVNGEDGLEFRDWFSSAVNQLDRVEFDNGSLWDQQDILALAAGEKIADPPLLQTPLGDSEAIAAVPFSVAIPQSTFVHAGGAISYSVGLADGSPLPGWISFDSDRLLLSGVPGSGKAGTWNFRVIATVENGPPASDLFTLSINSVAGKILTGDLSDERLTGTGDADVIAGGGGRNELKGRGGDDWFPIIGNQQGVNLFNGGDGIDRIQGSADDDLIQVKKFKGDNRVEIIDGGAGFDILSGDDAANKIDLRDTQLVGIERIDGRGGDDSITGSAGRDTIRGGKGDDLLRGGEAKDKLFGGAGDDRLDGGAGNDKLKGGSGRDSLYGGSGNDEIDGGKGKDAIYGAAGDDSIDGGAGADHIFAGDGNDTLSFGRGDGHDSLVTGKGTEDELDRFVDRVMFGSGVSADQLWFEASKTDLDISIIGTRDKLTIVDWYSNSASKADALVTSDGSVLTPDNVDRLVSAMAGFNPPSMGQTQLPAEMLAELEPVIAAGWH